MAANRPNALNLNADFKPLIDSVNLLVKALDRLERKLDSIAKGPSVFQKLFSSSKEFDGFVSAINKLQDINVANFGKLTKSMQDLAFATKSLAIGPGTIIKDFVDAISLLQNITIPAKSATGITGFFSSIKDVFSKVGIGTAPPVDKFKQFFEFFRFISLALSSIANETVNSKGIENIRFLSGALLRFISVTEEAFKALETSTLFRKPGIIGRIFRVNQFSPLFDFLRFISRNLANIANITASDKGLENIRKLSGALLNIAKAIPDIMAASQLLPGNVFSVVKRLQRFFELQKLFALIAFVARNLAGIANKTQNLSGLDNLRTLSGALLKISEAIPNILDAARAIPGNILSIRRRIQRLLQLRQLFGITRDIVRGLNSVAKSVKVERIDGVVRSLEAIRLFAQTAESIHFERVDLTGFKKFATELASGLSQFNKVKINTGFFSSLGQLTNLNFTNLKTIPNIGNTFSKIFSSGNLTNLVRGRGADFATRFSIGFSERLGAALGESLFSAFRSLDPRKISLDKIFRTDAFNQARGFDKLSSQIQVFGRLSDESLKKAQEFANVIGIKYPLSSNEALDAILKLIKAGEQLNTIEFILPSAADLAALSDSGDLDLMTNTLIGAERAFAEFSDGIEGSFQNIAKAADIISAASDVSTASVESLSEGLADVSRLAADAGLTLEETSAALAVLDEAQLKSSEGGRGLRAALNAIFKDKSQDEFEKLGIAIFDASGNVRSFDAILKDLNKRFKGLTQQQVIESLGNISDTFGRTTLSALIANNGISDMVDQMQSVGSASDRAGKLLDNFDGDVEQLRGSMETLNTRALLPFIDEFARPVVQLLRVIVDAFNNLPQPVLDVATHVALLVSSFATFAAGNLILIRVLGKLALVLSGVGSGIIALYVNLPTIIAGFGLFITTIGVLSIALTGILAVLTGVSAAIVTTFKVIKDNVGGAGDTFAALRATVGEVFDAIGIIIFNLGTVINTVFGRDAQGLYTTFGIKVGNAISFVNFKLKGFLDTLNQVALFTGGLSDVLTLDRSNLTQLNRYFRTLQRIAKLDITKRIFGDEVSVDRLDTFFKNSIAVLNQLRRAFSDLGGGLVDLIFNFDAGKIKLKRGIASLLSIATTAIQRFTGLDLGEAITSFNRQRITQGINNLTGAIAKALSNFVAKNKEKFIDLGSQLFNFFFVRIRGVGLGAASFILRLLGLDNVAQAVDQVQKVIIDTFGDILEFAIDVITGDIGSVDELANRFVGIIRDALNRVPDLLRSVGLSLNLAPLIDFGNLLENTDVFNKFVDVLGKLINYPIDNFEEALAGVGVAFETIVENKEASIVLGGIAAAIGLIINRQAVVSILSNVAGAVKTLVFPITAFVAITELLKNMEDFAAGNVGKGIEDTLVGIAKTLASFVGLEFTEEQLTSGIHRGVAVVELIINAFIDRMKIGIQNIFDGLVNEGIRAFARFQVLGGVVQEGFGVDFSKIDESLAAGLDSANLQKIADVIASPANIGLIQTQLRTAFAQIFKTFEEVDLPALARENSPDFDNILRILINAGGFQDALESVARETPEFLNEFIQRAFTVAPEDLAALDLDAVLGELRSKLFSVDPGGLNLDTLSTIIAEFYRGGLISLEKGDEFINQVNADSVRLQTAFSELTTAPVDVIESNLPPLEDTINDMVNRISEAINKFGGVTREQKGDIASTIFNELFGERPLEDQQAGLEAIAKTFGGSLAAGVELAAQAAETAQINFGGLGTIFTKVGDNILQTFANVNGQANLFKDGLEQVATIADNLKLTGLSDFLRDRAAALKDFSGFKAPTIESGTIVTEDNTDQLEANIDATESYNDALEEEENIKKKIAKFQLDEARKLFDDQKEEQKASEKIDEIKNEFIDKEKEDLAKFNLDKERAEEDHRNKLLEIARTGDLAFNNAIASRDASAAQSAQESLREQTKSENDQFLTNQKRAKEDFDLQVIKNQQERDQKLLAARNDLADLIAKNQLERDRRLEDYNIEMADLNAKIANKQAVQQQADLVEAQAHFNQNALLNVIATNGMILVRDTVAGKFGEIGQITAGILGALVNGFINTQNQIVASYTNAIPGSTVPRPVTPTRRAGGGEVFGGQIYQVADPDSELFKVGNKTYLIPGQNGTIIPPVNRRAGAAGMNVNVAFDFGGFTINSATGNPEQIALEVEKRVATKLTDGIRRAIAEGNR